MNKSFLILFFLIFLNSCGQDYNSNYNDRGTYADIGIPPGDPLYNSYIILQNKCFSCHVWGDYKTSAQWESAGLVTAGNFNGSTIIKSLKNYGGNMPKDPYSPLTSTEIESLKVWINSL